MIGLVHTEEEGHRTSRSVIFHAELHLQDTLVQTHPNLLYIKYDFS